MLANNTARCKCQERCIQKCFFKKLFGNPEVMVVLQSLKMQEAMQLVIMMGDREDLKQTRRGVPELQESVKKLI